MTLYTPDPRLLNAGLDLFDVVKAAEFPQTVLRYRNDRVARSVGLEHLTDDDWRRHFGQFEALPDNQTQPLALRYHGHQFRHYNPDLGDGRGFLFAQMRDDQGRLLDLGTKGSGRTPWSRGGDGRLTLKGGVREVLATALLEALGVPTSQSFSLIETGEALHRGDEPSPTRSSVLVRLSHSHIRFGTFERLAYLDDAKTMRGLVGYVIAHHYPDCHDAAELFDAVVTASARLAARWMAAGFVHGVLNTDNMNMTGESFDYGPYRFLSYCDPAFTAAYFDHAGLYAYGRQPDAVLWNLSQLGRALTLITGSDTLIVSLNDFSERYERELGLAFCARLNVVPRDDNRTLIEAVYALLGQIRVDGSFEGLFHDWRGGTMNMARAMDGRLAPHYRGEVFERFHACLDGYLPGPGAASDHVTPQTLLIDEIEVIWSNIAQDDNWQPFYDKLAAIERFRQDLGLTP